VKRVGAAQPARDQKFHQQVLLDTVVKEWCVLPGEKQKWMGENSMKGWKLPRRDQGGIHP